MTSPSTSRETSVSKLIENILIFEAIIRVIVCIWDDHILRQMVHIVFLFFFELLEILVKLGKFALSLHRIHTRYIYKS